MEVTVSMQIDSGVIIKRQAMTTTQEEAYYTIVQQLAEVKTNKVLAVGDNTDIWVRRLHLCCQGGIPTLICRVGFANS